MGANDRHDESKSNSKAILNKYEFSGNVISSANIETNPTNLALKSDKETNRDINAPNSIDSIENNKTSKFPFNILFSKKIEKPKIQSLKPFEIYKFADKWDIMMMIIGSITAIAAGACHPINFLLYRSSLNTIFELGISAANFNQNLISQNRSNFVTTSVPMNTLIKYYVILGFCNILFSWIAWTTWIASGERQVRRIRYALFRNILRQEIGWFDAQKTGELNNRLAFDLDKIKDGISDKVADFITIIAKTLGSLLYALIVGWKLSLVFLSLSPILVFVFNITIKILQKYTMKEVQAFTSASSIAQEVFENIRTVTAFHGQQKEVERFGKSLVESKNVGEKKGLYAGICQGVCETVNHSALALIIWYGPYLFRHEPENYSPGSTIAVFVACIATIMGASQCVPNIQNFVEASISGRTVFDLIERKSQIDASNDDGEKPQTIEGNIQFNNVSFTYPTRPEVSILNKLALNIPSGKTIALVGSSGCGKSTIVQLIQRFYDPDEGEVLLDGKDIRKLNVSWIRSNIGIVHQEPVLFTGTIEENIRLGKLDATDGEVKNAAKLANAHDFIMELPQNYATRCADKLSGGQKQRIAIARAIISNPKILLLDEATSALDNTSENLVQMALDKAKEGRTTLIVAHRMSTIQNADLIIALDDGKIIESGNHDELIERKGRYYELVNSQSRKDDEDNLKGKIFEEIEQTNNQNYSMIPNENIENSSKDLVDQDEDLSKRHSCFDATFLSQILKMNSPEWYWILFGTIVSIVFGTSEPFFALIFTNIYGAFTAKSDAEQNRLTTMYAIICFLIGLGKGIGLCLTGICFSKSGEALTMRMRMATFTALIRQEISYFDLETNSVGALVTRLSSDTAALKGLTGIRISYILQSISAVVTALIITLSASWKLTLVGLSLSPLMIIAGAARSNKERRAGKIRSTDAPDENGGKCAAEAIEHIRTVVSLGQENYFANLYERAFDQELKIAIRHSQLTVLGASLTSSSLYFLECACFSYGSKLVRNGEIRYDHVYRVLVVITLSLFAVGRSISYIPDYSKAKAAAIRILNLQKRKSKIDPNNQSGLILNNIIGDIEFKNVAFHYENRPNANILQKFSFHCLSNNRTALVGPSGTGKSTVIALLQRFYDPTSGNILLDGYDIQKLNIKWLRSLMGFVQQQPILFNLSIRENITYGSNEREVTQNQIENAARMANIHQFVTSLPMGYDTLCGAKGSQLSGGEKQRIAIARALIRNPKILLFDEATSALDNQSEKIVQAALEQAQTDRTCLTIAHRLSTIQNSERIGVIYRGTIIEQGTHDELINLQGLYTKLAMAQAKSSDN